MNYVNFQSRLSRNFSGSVNFKPVFSSDSVNVVRPLSKTTTKSMSQPILFGKNPGEPILPFNAVQMAIALPSLAGLILFSVYRAMLSASLAIKIEHKPYSSISEIVSSQKQIIIEDQSAIHQHILQPGLEVSQLNNPNLKPVLDDTIGSMTNILNGTFTNSLLVGSQAIEFMDDYPCQIGKLGISLAKRSTGMVFQKNWPFTELFNWHLHSIFLESGILHKFLEELRGKSKACQDESIEATRLSQIAVVFVLLALCIILTLTVLTYELLYKNATRSNMNIFLHRKSKV